MLDALDGKVIWSREYVETRFKWKKRDPLWILALRVHRLHRADRGPVPGGVRRLHVVGRARRAPRRSRVAAVRARALGRRVRGQAQGRGRSDPRRVRRPARRPPSVRELLAQRGQVGAQVLEPVLLGTAGVVVDAWVRREDRRATLFQPGRGTAPACSCGSASPSAPWARARSRGGAAAPRSPTTCGPAGPSAPRSPRTDGGVRRSLRTTITPRSGSAALRTRAPRARATSAAPGHRRHRGRRRRSPASASIQKRRS